MENNRSLQIVQKGASPPCLGPRGVFCRGCPGWPAMRRAASPGGPWEGSLIHCPCTGLSVRSLPREKRS
ncbi:MAG: hypothetical protein K9K66_11395 [Desulfarculaceae bacterium]|nr:hypothetical protein [Desulfarculaceae bacterium]MCF8070815.1 hypothetical protein [Desulfarculaceae bacterium]MCF8102252.1 hypothetical protein [Desulfarculaceae bacterium]MCF8117686.1 hypothetical protein [Desulfarculaceae bacterium]